MISRRISRQLLCVCFQRDLRTVTAKSTISEGEIVSASSCPNPKNITSDMVGPADPVSNLRRVVWRQPRGESSLERQYREKRTTVHEWNQQFWNKHNINFFHEREQYIKKNLPSDKQTLTADEMSVFYKAFLDRNWRAHVAYNAEWYRRNLQLLRLAIAVKLSKLFGK